jgi:hypothetical protein
MSGSTGDYYPQSSPHDHRRLAAYACARVILEWHLKTGIALAPTRIDGEAQASYVEAVRRYAEMELYEAETQRQLAQEQVAGIFEWMYSEPCPQDLWYRITAELQVELDCPETMGATGQLLRDLVKHIGEEPEPQLRRTVHVRDRAQLLEHAEEFYQDLAAEERLGIGGKNAMLSCSLEGTSFSALEHREAEDVTLLRPEVLGMSFVAPGDRPDGLIDSIRNGRLVIQETTGEPPKGGVS